jgi:peroxiredoxin
MKSALLLLWAAAALPAGPGFRLRDTKGAIHTAAEWDGKSAIVLFFVTVDCPVANSYVPEMNRIAASYAAKGVAVYGVQAETSVGEAAVARYSDEFRYTFPLLLDPGQTLVKLVNATVTPQAAVVTPAGKVLYIGRIDNRVEDFGKTRFQATRADLREALDAVISNRPVLPSTTKSVGCAINRLP